MTRKEMQDRIAELEQRVRNLEAGPVYVPAPVFVPWTPVYPHHAPLWWEAGRTPAPPFEITHTSSTNVAGH